jgi:hypothetical protein
MDSLLSRVQLSVLEYLETRHDRQIPIIEGSKFAKDKPLIRLTPNANF